ARGPPNTVGSPVTPGGLVPRTVVRHLGLSGNGLAAGASATRTAGGDRAAPGRPPTREDRTDRLRTRPRANLRHPPVPIPSPAAQGTSRLGERRARVGATVGLRESAHRSEPRRRVASRCRKGKVLRPEFGSSGWAGRSVRKIAGFANRRPRVQIPTSPLLN